MKKYTLIILMALALLTGNKSDASSQSLSEPDENLKIVITRQVQITIDNIDLDLPLTADTSTPFTIRFEGLSEKVINIPVPEKGRATSLMIGYAPSGTPSIDFLLGDKVIVSPCGLPVSIPNNTTSLRFNLLKKKS